MLKWLSLLCCTILLLATAQSQPAGSSIGGVLQNGQQRPLEGATVSLLKLADSALVKMTVSGKDGQFAFEKLSPGQYRILVNATGYQPYYSAGFSLTASPFVLPAVQLQEAVADAGHVTVTSTRKPVLEIRPDKMVVNVDASVTNVGATALEVLQKSPGVTVDKDGNISLKGKQNVLVMLDGKPTYMSGTDLSNLLSTMNANQLDQIEIMTNPSSKFDAAGNAGIINIKTKKNKTRGFNGSATLGYGQGRYAKTNNSLNLNYRGSKYNIFMNCSFSASKDYIDLHLKRTYLASDGKTVTALFDEPTYLIFKRHSNNLKLGMDYYLSPKTTVGITATGFISPRNLYSTSSGYLNNAVGYTDSITHTYNTDFNRWKNGGINANFRHQFDSTQELTADLDYITYHSGSNQQFITGTSYADGKPDTHESLKGSLPSVIAIYSAKADYSKTFKSGVKLESGVKSSYVKNNSVADYYNLADTGWQPDYTKTNHFIYRENINALYVNFTKQWGKWNTQAGLRYENTQARGHQLGNPGKTDSAFTRNYGSLFPTLYITYNATASHQFTVSFGRRTDRPAYQQLNPFLFFINKYTYQQGNPFLNPQYTYNIELSHVYKGFLTTTLNYSNTQHYITQVFNTIGQATVLGSGNLGKLQTMGVSFNAQVPVTKWWSSTLHTDINYKILNGINNGDVINTSAFNAQVNVNNQLHFNQGWAAELSGYYNTKDVEGQFVIHPQGDVSAGISKQVCKNKGTVKLNVRDIFFTQVTRGEITYQNVREHFVQSRDSRVLNISFTYRFGKTLNDKPRGNHNGASDEQQRVRT